MVFDKPLQKSSEKLLNSLCGRLRVKYGEKDFYFCDKTGLMKSAAYRTTGRYTYSVMYFNRIEGDEICLMFPIKEWSAEFFEKLEDKIIKTLDFCVAKTKEEE
jgi:hypothetical protein